MNIYLSTETSFDNNGLGFLTDSISALVEESLNGDYTLNITYPLNGKLNEYLVKSFMRLLNIRTLILKHMVKIVGKIFRIIFNPSITPS